MPPWIARLIAAALAAFGAFFFGFGMHSLRAAGQRAAEASGGAMAPTLVAALLLIAAGLLLFGPASWRGPRTPRS